MRDPLLLAAAVMAVACILGAIVSLMFLPPVLGSVLGMACFVMVILLAAGARRYRQRRRQL